MIFEDFILSDNVCLLIMAHKDIKYFYQLSLDNPDIRFYIHYDRKYELPNLPQSENLIFLPDHLRVNVKWGGISQVYAMLNLFKFSKNHSNDNHYFHLVSGEDLILCDNKKIADFLKWNGDDIFIHCVNSKNLRYRARFNAFHAETIWQRNFLGKILTKLMSFLDFLIKTEKVYWTGSNWFSIKRPQLDKIFLNLGDSDLSYFRKKLNPDEHFFQHMIYKSNLQANISKNGNRRYIIFDKSYNNGNNPVYLGFDKIFSIYPTNQYWFCRKVITDNQAKFYSKVNS